LDRALQYLIASNDRTGVRLSTCNAVDKDRLRQRFAYLALIYSTGKQDAQWTSSPDECEWVGISCKGKTVNAISLDNKGLQGTIPDDVGLWTGLTVFYVPTNVLAGSLPSSIGMWTSLVTFDVSINALGGTVPKEVSKWTRLIIGAFHRNNFGGTMPAIGTNFCPKKGIGGKLSADCKANRKIVCECCSECN
jgi:hypothetical protein